MAKGLFSWFSRGSKDKAVPEDTAKTVPEADVSAQQPADTSSSAVTEQAAQAPATEVVEPVAEVSPSIEPETVIIAPVVTEGEPSDAEAAMVVA